MRTLAFLFALFAAPAFAQAPPDLDRLRDLALEAVNGDRVENGLGRLEPLSTLDRIAQRHARDMLAKSYLAHEAPDGTDVRDRFLAAGGSELVVVGENLAKCTGCAAPGAARIKELQRGWMESPGHRANILTEGFDRFGFGIVARDGTQYAVQTFSGAGADEGEGIDAEAAAELAAELMNVDANEALREALAAQASFDAAPDLDAIYRSLGARDWASLNLLSATCGGCGREPTRADVERFVRQWSESNAVPAGATDGGFVLLTDEKGGKRAFALLGTRR